MANIFRKLLTPPVFPNDEEKTRAAELLNTVLVGLTILTLVALLAFWAGGTVPLQGYVIVSVFLGLLLGLNIVMRLGYVRLSGIFTILFFTATLTLVLIQGGTVRAPGVALYVAVIIMSGLILGRSAAYWAAATIVLLFSSVQWLELNGKLPPANLTLTVQQPIIFSVNAVLVATLLTLALRRINESLAQAHLNDTLLLQLNTDLEKRVQERTAELAESTNQIQKRASQLETIAKTARSAASANNLNELLTTFTRDISERFGFYHVGIFLIENNREYAVLSAANSEGGAKMLAREHRLKVGAQGMVGYVAARGTPRIALNVGEETVFFNNPDLPETQSEMSLPLRFGGEIIGVLDIQSKTQNAFSEQDVEIFSILADQVSVAIQNARSLEKAQRALLEVELATSQLTGQAWKQHTEMLALQGYRYDGVKSEPLRTGTKGDTPETLTIPVRLRGQLIGRLKLKASDTNRQWSADERAIIDSTAERMAIALEGARLLDEAQKRATREQRISEISSKLGSTFQLDSILRDTVEELGQALNGSIVSFQLVNPSAPPSPPPQAGNGSDSSKAE